MRSDPPSLLSLPPSPLSLIFDSCVALHFVSNFKDSCWKIMETLVSSSFSSSSSSFERGTLTFFCFLGLLRGAYLQYLREGIVLSWTALDERGRVG